MKIVDVKKGQVFWHIGKMFRRCDDTTLFLSSKHWVIIATLDNKEATALAAGTEVELSTCPQLIHPANMMPGNVVCMPHTFFGAFMNFIVGKIANGWVELVRPYATYQNGNVLFGMEVITESIASNNEWYLLR